MEVRGKVAPNAQNARNAQDMPPRIGGAFMKRNLVFGMLGFLMAPQALFAPQAVLAATSGTVTLSGSVPAATAIVVTGVSGYNSLDLSTTASDLAVASIREINNTANGYRVTVASTTGGALKNGTLGSIPYTAKYGGSTVTLSTTPAVVTNTGSTTSVVNVVKSLQVSYSGTDLSTLMQGSYSDTLTFTISAN